MIEANKSLTILAFKEDQTGDITENFFSKVSNLASARIQLLPALKSAQKIGLKTNIFSIHSTEPSDLERLAFSDFCLISKMSADKEQNIHNMAMANLAAVARLKCLGSKIIIQYCDHLLCEKNIISDFYKDLFKFADYCIYPTHTLFQLSKPYLNAHCRPTVIPDPWQLKNWHLPRKYSKGQTFRIIWFGANKNIHYLLKSLPSMLSRSPQDINFELTILGLPFAFNATKKFIIENNINSTNWSVRLVTWNQANQPSQLEMEIARAHMAVIPSDPQDPNKKGVSHNRLVDAIRGGCITIASPMESYEELSSLALLGNDMGKLIENAIENYQTYCQNLIRLREEPLSNFSPELNRLRWEKYWKKLSNF